MEKARTNMGGNGHLFTCKSFSDCLHTMQTSVKRTTQSQLNYYIMIQTCVCALLHEGPCNEESTWDSATNDRVRIPTKFTIRSDETMVSKECKPDFMPSTNAQFTYFCHEGILSMTSQGSCSASCDLATAFESG